ncbi:methyltransferase domain-containing protein [bacterium]|nr:methyltransferase domain-containing protein [candidate division CSSED10-310 bacterium]
MTLTQTAPDRFNRFFFTARYLRALCPDGFGERRILDLGSTENILTLFLDDQTVIQSDISRKGVSGRFVQSMAERTPFPSGCFDFTVCLDVLEHVDSFNRNLLLQEIDRITSDTAIISFPMDKPKTVAHETYLAAIHLKFAGESYRFLDEHRENGLIDWKTIIDFLALKFPFIRVYHTFPLQLWALAHVVDYTLGLLPETSKMRDNLFRCINHLPIITGNEHSAYRTFIIASRHHEHPEFSNDHLSLPEEDYINSDTVESFERIQEALQTIHQYVRRVEAEHKSISQSFHYLEDHARKIQKELDQYRDRNNMLEISNNDLTERIRLLAEEAIRAQSESAVYDQLESYALHLETTLTEKDRIITDLQAKFTQLLAQIVSGQHKP